MDRFEYVMVLISIIVGLSIAHALIGVGGLIDRKASGKGIRLGVAHGFWLGYVFLWTVQFWWWEFRFSEIVEVWTLALYMFLVSYAVSLFLLTVILVPRSWDGVDDLDEHFIQRRVWFYLALAVAAAIDVADGYLKGGSSYIFDDLGFSMISLWIMLGLAVAFGLASKDLRIHRIAAIAVFFGQVYQGFADFETLGF